MKIFYQSLFFILITSFTVYSQSEDIYQIKYDIEYLASDDLEGRFPGTNGEDLAADFIADKFNEYGLSKIGDSYFQNFSFTLPSSPHEDVKFNQENNNKIEAKNVVGLIDNKKETTIIIGAHYDHIGYGGQYSLDRGINEIHNGADDNASGTAMLLNLVKKLSKRNNSKSNYLFIGFSAEELGLLGSRYFVNSNLYDEGTCNMMINLDMVGR